MVILSKKQVRKTIKKEPVVGDIIKIFFDSSNRAKRAPLHLSAIQRKLEDNHHPWQVNEGLKKLKRIGILSSSTSETSSIRKIVFYYPSSFDDNPIEKNLILQKITKSCLWIEKYSNQRITSILGKHLHALVKAELRAQGFVIIKEGKVRSYNGIVWNESKDSLDMIAQHASKKIVLGVEIKNTLDVINKKELNKKIRMCKIFGITPLFACRWLKPYLEEIKNNNGFPWQFRFQLYPLSMEELVERIQKRFGFRMKTATEIPHEATIELEEYLKSIH